VRGSIMDKYIPWYFHLILTLSLLIVLVLSIIYKNYIGWLFIHRSISFGHKIKMVCADVIICTLICLITWEIHSQCETNEMICRIWMLKFRSAACRVFMETVSTSGIITSFKSFCLWCLHFDISALRAFFMKKSFEFKSDERC